LPPATNVLWTQQFGSDAYDEARAIASDVDGNAIVAGYTMGGLEGDPVGGADVFVRSYRPDGTSAWTDQFGTTADDVGYAVATDPNGNAFGAGSSTGDVAGESAGWSDVFVRKYSQSGTVMCTRQFGTAAHDDLRGVTADEAGNVYLAG